MSKEFSLQEVKKNGYLIIRNYVYDISKFAKFHPGGEKLLFDYGGTDVTEDFEGLHRNEVLDKYHKRLCIGKLKNTKTNDNIENFGDISTVPYAESGYWQGLKSPYFNESHDRFRKALRKFYFEEILTIAEQYEKQEKSAGLDIYKLLSEKGVLGTYTGPGEHLKLMEHPIIGNIKPNEFDYFHELITHEERARLFNPGFEDSMEAGINIGSMPLYNYGNDHIKNTVLKEILNGRKRICLAITEPFVGSDVASIRTTAEKTPDGRFYIVNGAKKWITNGTFADYFTTAVRTSDKGRGGISMLLIERTEGVKTEIIKTDYSSAAGTAYITFENVKVPVENLLGTENQGFKIVVSNFNHERWTIAAYALARTRVIIEEMLKWSYQRKVFNKRLIDEPFIQSKIAESIAIYESANAYLLDMTYQLNNMSYQEQTKKLAGRIAILKYMATNAGEIVSKNSVHVLGGRGITTSGMGRKVSLYQKTNLFPSIYGGSTGVMGSLAVKQIIKTFPKNSKL